MRRHEIEGYRERSSRIGSKTTAMPQIFASEGTTTRGFHAHSVTMVVADQFWKLLQLAYRGFQSPPNSTSPQMSGQKSAEGFTQYVLQTMLVQEFPMEAANEMTTASTVKLVVSENETH